MRKSLFRLQLKKKEKLVLTEFDKKFNLIDQEKLAQQIKEEPALFGLRNTKLLTKWWMETPLDSFSCQDFYQLVIYPLAHPSFTIDEMRYTNLKTFYWKNRLGPKIKRLKDLQHSVGRLLGYHINGKRKWLGTCFRVGKNLIITASSNIKCKKPSSNMVYMVDFSTKRQTDAEKLFTIKKIIHHDLKRPLGLTILQVEEANKANHYIPKGLSLSGNKKQDDMVALIGFPLKRPSKSSTIDLVGSYGSSWNLAKKHIAPGHLIREGNTNGKLMHDCFTAPGYTGAPIIDLENYTVVGLHLQHSGLAISAQQIRRLILEST